MIKKKKKKEWLNKQAHEKDVYHHWPSEGVNKHFTPTRIAKKKTRETETHTLLMGL